MASSIDLFNLSGKLALTTGSSQDIGFAMARGLAAAGTRVVVNGRDTARLQQIRAELQTPGIGVSAAAFLAPDASSVFNGHILYVDGDGWINSIV